MKLRDWARAAKRDVLAVYLAARDPRVPWHVKALALAIAGYALSPIDLIPDFIPVLGYLDDLVIVPAGIALVKRVIPPAFFAEHRARADAIAERPTSRLAAMIIVIVWLVGVGTATWFFWPRARRVLQHIFAGRA